MGQEIVVVTFVTLKKMEVDPMKHCAPSYIIMAGKLSKVDKLNYIIMQLFMFEQFRKSFYIHYEDKIYALLCIISKRATSF